MILTFSILSFFAGCVLGTAMTIHFVNKYLKVLE